MYGDWGLQLVAYTVAGTAVLVGSALAAATWFTPYRNWRGLSFLMGIGLSLGWFVANALVLKCWPFGDSHSALFVIGNVILVSAESFLLVGVLVVVYRLFKSVVTREYP